MSSIEEKPVDAESLNIAIEYYTGTQDTEPDEAVYDEIYQRIEEMDGIPTGEYHLYLNDNYILIEEASGKKENTINKIIIERIKKE